MLRIAKILIKQKRILTRTSQASIIQPSRLPIKDAPAQPRRDIPDRLNRPVNPLQLPLNTNRNLRLTKIGYRIILPIAEDGIVRLDNEDRLAVRIGDGVERGSKIRKCCCGAVEGVEGEAE